MPSTCAVRIVATAPISGPGRHTSRQAGRQAAGHLLALASTRAEDAGRADRDSIQDRDAMASRVISLVNPELARPPRADSAQPAPVSSAARAATGIPPAFRHILERKLPKGWGYGVLVALAGAEGFLNVRAFAATGENSGGSLVLAVLVGTGVIGLAPRRPHQHPELGTGRSSLHARRRGRPSVHGHAQPVRR